MKFKEGHMYIGNKEQVFFICIKAAGTIDEAEFLRVDTSFISASLHSDPSDFVSVTNPWSATFEAKDVGNVIALLARKVREAQLRGDL